MTGRERPMDPRSPEGGTGQRPAPERARAAPGENRPGGGDVERFAARWDAIQANFVDDPRSAVAQADDLVAEVTDHFARAFAQQREELHRLWRRGEEPSTESLRLCLQRYRLFFQRLLDAA